MGLFKKVAKGIAGGVGAVTGLNYLAGQLGTPSQTVRQDPLITPEQQRAMTALESAYSTGSFTGKDGKPLFTFGDQLQGYTPGQELGYGYTPGGNMSNYGYTPGADYQGYTPGADMGYGYSPGGDLPGFQAGGDMGYGYTPGGDLPGYEAGRDLTRYGYNAGAEIPGFNAGQPYQGRLGNFNMTGLERSGQSKLYDMMNSTLPSTFNSGTNEINTLLNTNQYDPFNDNGVYSGFRDNVNKQVQDATGNLKRNANFTGNLYSTNTIKKMGDIQEQGQQQLTNKLGDLYDTFVQRKLSAIPMALNAGQQEENLNQGRIASAYQYGSLPRTLSDTQAQRTYAESMRARGEGQQDYLRRDDELRQEALRRDSSVAADAARRYGETSADAARRRGELYTDSTRRYGETAADAARRRGEVYTDVQRKYGENQSDATRRYGEVQTDAQRRDNAVYQEALRRRQEQLTPLQIAQQLAGQNANFGAREMTIPGSNGWNELLGMGAELGGAYLGRR